MKLRREFMEQAIANMLRSIPEDATPRPKVGMVVVKDGRAIANSWRGMREPGEHAEFGGLQRELLHRNVEGATLYTTLEPCTTRNHGTGRGTTLKQACAEWIIARRITTVVIGLLDSDPSICGKGFWMLRDAGIKLSFFPPDLMERVYRSSKDFFDMAKRRPAGAIHGIGTEAAHLEAERALVKDYIKKSGFPESMYIDGAWRPNVPFATMSPSERNRLRRTLRRAGSRSVSIDRRDIFLIKANDRGSRSYLLAYFSGKARSGWQTWLFPNRKRDHEQGLSERLRKPGAFIAADLGVSERAVEVTYAPGMPMSVCLKTNRYAKEVVLRHPKIYVCRYCHVRIDSPPPDLLQRSFHRQAGDYRRDFRWLSSGGFETDRRMWNANADVLTTIDKVFEPTLTNVPSSVGRRTIEDS